MLGTGDDEILRLELQHAIWRSDAAAAWRRAGFRPGQTIIDVGSGPGFATLDLAVVVGSVGRVVAVDQSQRFLDHLNAQCATRGIHNVLTRLADLSAYGFSEWQADGAWLRWVLSFVPRPDDVLRRVVDGLRPGGKVVVHEYFAYESWRVIPRDAAFEQFVDAVMTSWRARGGEPNVGLALIPCLEQAGLTIDHTRTISDVVRADDSRWHWPVTFAETGLERLIQLGNVDVQTAVDMRASIRSLGTRGGWMVTPSVLEIIARKP